jgi:hypothetical protein
MLLCIWLHCTFSYLFAAIHPVILIHPFSYNSYWVTFVSHFTTRIYYRSLTCIIYFSGYNRRITCKPCSKSYHIVYNCFTNIVSHIFTFICGYLVYKLCIIISCETYCSTFIYLYSSIHIFPLHLSTLIYSHSDLSSLYYLYSFHYISIYSYHPLIYSLSHSLYNPF